MSQNLVYCRARKGSPMPSSLSPYISEHNYLLFRDDCERSVSEQDFHNVINTFNNIYFPNIAVRGVEERHSVVDIVLESIFTLGGFLGAIKNPIDRTLIFDLNVLQRGPIRVVNVNNNNNNPNVIVVPNNNNNSNNQTIPIATNVQILS